MRGRRRTAATAGPGIDATGQAVVDPTENVLQLVAAAVERLDDLRRQDVEHNREKDRLRDQIADMRERHAEQMRAKEAARLDAIRSVDVGAVQRATEVQAAAATALASTVVASAEAMRTQVGAAASAAALSLAAEIEPLKTAIADLRRAQYEQQGQKTQQVETRSAGANTGMWIGIAVGATGLLLSIMALAATIVMFIVTR